MFAKIAVITCVLVLANAEGRSLTYESYSEPSYASYGVPTLTGTSGNIYRNAGNLHTISTHARTIASPYLSSNRHITGITNSGIYGHTSPLTYASTAPVVHSTYASSTPIVHSTYAASAPIAHSNYAAATPITHSTYAAASVPITNHARYATVPLSNAYVAAAPVAHANYATSAPIVHTSYANPIAHAALANTYTTGSYSTGLGHTSGLGYNILGAASGSQLTYNNPIGLNYSW